jgi:hypothetical protein
MTEIDIKPRYACGAGISALDGWRCCANHDRSGRRGMWYRVADGRIEVRAGREGDDNYMSAPIDSATGRGLRDLCETLAWVYDDLTDRECNCTGCVFEDFETTGDNE